MKKFSKKLGAIILSLALILVIAPVSAIFAGCGEKNPPAENPPAEEEFTLVGSWEATAIVQWITPTDDNAEEHGITDEAQEIVVPLEEGMDFYGIIFIFNEDGTGSFVHEGDVDGAEDFTWEEREGCVVIALAENDYVICPIIGDKVYFIIATPTFAAENEAGINAAITAWQAWQETGKTLSEYLYAYNGGAFYFEKQN